MTKIQNELYVLIIRILYFGIVSDFEIRISDLKQANLLNKNR